MMVLKTIIKDIEILNVIFITHIIIWDKSEDEDIGYTMCVIMT